MCTCTLCILDNPALITFDILTLTVRDFYLLILFVTVHRRRHGVHWVHVHTGRRKKISGPNLQGNVISAPPPPRQSKSPIFRKLRRFGRWERLFRWF